MPLVRGRYQTINPFWSLLFGQGINNAVQSDIPPRSNAEVFGYAGLTDQAAALTTAVCTTTPVPVSIGDVISTINVRIGATAAGTPTNAWAALYNGIAGGALLAQSTDTGSAAIAATQSYAFTLASQVVVTNTNAPKGFLYVSLMVKATTVPSLAAWTLPTALGLGPSNGSAGINQTNGSALTTTAPATITGGATAAPVPLVWLT